MYLFCTEDMFCANAGQRIEGAVQECIICRLRCGVSSLIFNQFDYCDQKAQNALHSFDYDASKNACCC